MGFCPSGLLSQWAFVLVGFCPVGFCPSGLISNIDKKPFFFIENNKAQLVERPLSEREVVGSNPTVAPYQRCKKWYEQLPC